MKFGFLFGCLLLVGALGTFSISNHIVGQDSDSSRDESAEDQQSGDETSNVESTLDEAVGRVNLNENLSAANLLVAAGADDDTQFLVTSAEDHDGVWLTLSPAVEQQVTVLGVHVRRPSSTLRSHLRMNDGMGLVIEQVVADSAAAEAGLQANDVLVSLDSQQLVNEEQLTTLVRNHEPGDTVTLTLFREGERSRLDVTLALGAISGYDTVDESTGGWLLESHHQFNLESHASMLEFMDCKACHMAPEQESTLDLWHQNN